MSKPLRITYGDVVLYDGIPWKTAWCETEGIVEVRAEMAPPAAKPNPISQLGQLMAQRKEPNGQPAE